MNKFKIITPSYNNSEWVEYNLASILNQSYTNYEVLYIDDASTDDTYKKVTDVVGHLSNWRVIRNEANMGATYNYVEHVEDYCKDPNDIIIHLDGDDWLYDENVLSKLNDFYNTRDVWMTYGGFLVWNSEDNVELPYPQSTEHPDIVHEYKLYRRDLWRASHLRTYRSFLFKAIKNRDLVSNIDNKYYWHAADLAWQYPCMEMCGKEKIGVVDFYTCVYNHSKQNQVRTHEREHVDNTKYEIEIRNRKTYKQGLSGEHLPLVNVVGDYRERNSIPKKFSYCYNQREGEFDVTLIQDMDILPYLRGDIKIASGKIIADIHEAPHLLEQQRVYDAVYENYQKFDQIHTFDDRLLTLPNAVFRNGGYEVVLNKNVHALQYPTLSDQTLIKFYENKPKQVSFITSNKVITEGHRFRVSCVEAIRNNRIDVVDVFGKGINEIVGKIEALQDYKFSIAIENGVCNNYFTEKILDCFLTGTIPIYRGCPNLNAYFDVRGIISFDTIDELLTILKSLSTEDYTSRLDYAKQNFETAKKYAYTNDSYFEKFIQPLI